MEPRVYVETTFVSYLVARPSQDVVLRAHQRLTERWWAEEREKYELYASPLVVQEAGAGDAEMARLRLDALRPMPLLAVTAEATALARTLVERGPLPNKAEADALHIALAAVHGADDLLTWNCKHIANARMRTQIETLCRAGGYIPPVLCTPEELTGG